MKHRDFYRTTGYRSLWMCAVSVLLAAYPLPAQDQAEKGAQGKERPMEHSAAFRTIRVDGLNIFYREAGPKDAPTLLLLYGLPSSSRMFAPLFERLAGHYQFSWIFSLSDRDTR